MIYSSLYDAAAKALMDPAILLYKDTNLVVSAVMSLVCDVRYIPDSTHYSPSLMVDCIPLYRATILAALAQADHNALQVLLPRLALSDRETASLLATARPYCRSLIFRDLRSRSHPRHPADCLI